MPDTDPIDGIDWDYTVDQAMPDDEGGMEYLVVIEWEDANGDTVYRSSWIEGDDEGPYYDLIEDLAQELIGKYGSTT
jgi:hypothetical protein